MSIFTSACSDASDCSLSSKEASYAKSLSESEFVDIHKATLELFESVERFHYEGPLPDALVKHHVKTIRVHDQIHLRLDGCMDKWVDLVVFDNVENYKIELRYGFNSREVLWEKQ